MAGLVTRIGQWIDERWEEKASMRYVQMRVDDAEAIQRQQNQALKDIAASHWKLIEVLKEAQKELDERFNMVIDNHRLMESKIVDVADLKTRIERIEVYSGMTRKVDPTKPPVAKSAFSM